MSREKIWTAGGDIWQRLQGKKIFLTGGTGYFGRSFLELITDFGRTRNLDFQVTILTRNATKFRESWQKSFNFDLLSFHEGDITNFSFPPGSFDYVLHFATPASATLNIENPLEMFNVVVDGTKQVLEFAKQAKVKSVLLASSGAVYGKQPHDMTHVPESYLGAPLTQLTSSAYGEGKRAAELLGNLYGKAFGFDHKIARCFAFVGPHLDPNGTFAIGNFVRDALTKDRIEVKGDGRSFRSYMYSDDLVVWLLKILLDGEHGRPYNVGSDQEVTIEQLGHLVFKALNKSGIVDVQGKPRPGALAERYVPSIELAREELGLSIWTSLEEAIRETARRYQELYK